MKYRIFLLAIILNNLTLLYSCQNNKSDIKEVILKKDTTIIQLSDSSYMSDVRSLFFDKYLYLTDYNRDQILILDKNGKLIKSMGRKGKGPGEFIGASHIYIYEDTLYIANDGKRSFEMYDFNKHLKTINLSPEIMLFSEFRFFLERGSVYLTSPSADNCIVSVNINSSNTDHLVKTLQQNFHKNKMHVYSYKNFIITVSDNMPIIEKYDFSGTLIEKFDYSEVPLVKKRIDFIQSQVESENSYYILLNDAFLKNDKLYILLCTHENNKINSNKILAIVLNKDRMSAQNVYSLGTGWYSTICVTDNNLWAFNAHECGLIKFSLK